MKQARKDETHGSFDIICKSPAIGPRLALRVLERENRQTFESLREAAIAIQIYICSVQTSHHIHNGSRTLHFRGPQLSQEAVRLVSPLKTRGMSATKSSHLRDQWLTIPFRRCPRRHWQRRPALHPPPRPSPSFHSHRRWSQPQERRQEVPRCCQVEAELAHEQGARRPCAQELQRRRVQG
jgi:hypothetical protein